MTKADSSAFLDLRGRLFGRQPDIDFLLGRASTTGLTAVVGRPKMGKTWLLLETARRLTEHGYLVGYHESKGETHDHLLRAAVDLYTRWLSDATMWQQARQVWNQQKSHFVTSVGQAVGRIFDALGQTTVVAQPVGALIRQCFDALGAAQKDLLSGAVQLAPLNYDQAHELIQVVTTVSGKPVVLILDAWQKSPSVRIEKNTLDGFLRHTDEWPRCHLFMGILHSLRTHPDEEDLAYEAARDLANSSTTAVVYDVPPMHLDDQKACDDLIQHICAQVPAARKTKPDRLLNLIDGFPGVIERWLSSPRREVMNTEHDLQREADDAQAYRYREFDKLLPMLNSDERTLAIRLTIFPRLDAHTWPRYREVLLDGLNDPPIDSLIISGILQDAPFPTFGHDTRHAAAQRWFIDGNNNRRSLTQRETEGLIFRIATCIGEHTLSHGLFSALAAILEPAVRLKLAPQFHALIHAAACMLGYTDLIDIYEFEVGWATAVKTNTAVAPLISMALTNRGYARRQRADLPGALADCTSVVAMPGLSDSYKAQALANLIAAKGEQGDYPGCIAEYDALLKMPDLSIKCKAQALLNRGLSKQKQGDHSGAIIDFRDARSLPNAPREFVDKASEGEITSLLNGGVAKGMQGEHEDAVKDFDDVIGMSHAANEHKANAHFNRGVAQARQGNHQSADHDFDVVINMPGAPIDLQIRTRIVRGRFRLATGNTCGAGTDFVAAYTLAKDAGLEKLRVEASRMLYLTTMFDRPDWYPGGENGKFDHPL